jgi:hypothetical protein
MQGIQLVGAKFVIILLGSNILLAGISYKN